MLWSMAAMTVTAAAGVVPVPDEQWSVSSPWELLSGDFDGDGDDELVALSRDRFDVVDGDPAGLVRPGASIAVPDVQDLLVLDATGDGLDDLVVVIWTGGFGGYGESRFAVELFPGTPTGVSASSVWTLPGSLWSTSAPTLAGGDFDGDGDDELVACEATPPGYGDGGWCDVYLGDPTGQMTFGTHWTRPAGSSGLLGLAFSDVDGDGYEDLAASQRDPAAAIGVYRGGPGPLPVAPRWIVRPPAGHLWFEPQLVGGVDLDGDGFEDLAALLPTGQEFAVVHGGARGPGAAVAVAPGAPFSLNLAPSGDVDGDGRDELLLAWSNWRAQNLFQAGLVAVFLGGTTAPQGLGPLASRGANGDELGYLTVAGDFDGDGRADRAFSLGTNRTDVAVVYAP